VPHVYATLAEADDYILGRGSNLLSGQSAEAAALKLAILESVSRRIDDVAERSDFGSGFGPRIGTNRYDGSGGSVLRLHDDLLTVSAITIRPSTASSSTQTPAADTDYYLVDAMDEYSTGPFRKLLLHGQGSVTSFGYGYRVTDVAGIYGHQNVTIPTGTTVASGLASDAAATSFVSSASPALSPGMTLLIGSEQLYVYVVSGTTITVVRGANGSTAATHANSSAIARYVYDARVHEVGLRLFTKRWKARDAGADGSDGGGEISMVTGREGEDTIIRRGLSNLVLKSVR
jgi:hypothetical protein